MQFSSLFVQLFPQMPCSIIATLYDVRVIVPRRIISFKNTPDNYAHGSHSVVLCVFVTWEFHPYHSELPDWQLDNHNIASMVVKYL